MEDKWVPPLTCGGIGLILFVSGIVMSYRRYALSRDGVMTQGHVVKLEVRESDESSDYSTNFVKRYHPVIEFRSAGEKQHHFELGGSTSVGDYVVGATVTVLYDRGNPANARIADLKQPPWHQPLLALGLFGLAFLAIGIVFSVILS